MPASLIAKLGIGIANIPASRCARTTGALTTYTSRNLYKRLRCRSPVRSCRIAVLVRNEPCGPSRLTLYAGARYTDWSRSYLLAGIRRSIVVIRLHVQTPLLGHVEIRPGWVAVSVEEFGGSKARDRFMASPKVSVSSGNSSRPRFGFSLTAGAFGGVSQTRALAASLASLSLWLLCL
jgi:hypothetical protein